MIKLLHLYCFLDCLVILSVKILAFKQIYPLFLQSLGADADFYQAPHTPQSPDRKEVREFLKQWLLVKKEWGEKKKIDWDPN